MVVQLFIRRTVGVDRLSLNNEVAGFIFAIIGVVYAVLLAFVVIAVWEKFSEGQTSVAKESAAAAALLYYSEGPEPEAAKLRENLVHYLHRVIEGDWPAMGRKSEDSQTTDALMALYRAAMALNRTGARSIPDMSEVFTQVDNLTLARRMRLHLSTGLVPEIIWITLFAGAGLHRLLRLVLRQSQRIGAPHDDRDAVDCSRVWAGRHHRARPPVQRPRAHHAGSTRKRARHRGARIARTPASGSI